jgi:hypothetical protein
MILTDHPLRAFSGSRLARRIRLAQECLLRSFLLSPCPHSFQTLSLPEVGTIQAIEALLALLLVGRRRQHATLPTD